MTDTIKCWSFSALNIYEDCPYRAYLKYVQREKEPPREAGNAADRGSISHDEAEHFVRGTGPLTPVLKKFKDEFEELQAAFSEGDVSLEEEWGLNRSWEPVSWQAKDLWCRLKLDACQHLDIETARIIDYKTGKSWGNEVKHSQQGLLYTLATFLRFPLIKYVQTQFWYLDEGKKNPTANKIITRESALRFLPRYDQRAVAMTTATEFPPKANKFTCKWCPYHPDRGGQCAYGASDDTGRK